MPTDAPGEITRLLQEAYDGREGALDEVMGLVYTDLKHVAEKHLRARHGPQAHDITLEPTALVNEAFLRLIKQRKRYDNRGQFFAIATRVMMRVLMDYYRAKGAAKRGGDQVRVTLSGLGRAGARDPSTEIPAFIQAVEKLETLDEKTAEVVKLRVMWGLTNPEIADTTGMALRTVEREWQFARRWLAAELRVAGV